MKRLLDPVGLPLLAAALLLLAGARAQQVTLPEEVRFGAAFEVVVESDGGFDPAQLAPLAVEVVERSANSGGGERLRLRARCYELGDVTLSLDPPRTLRVASALPEPAGELEWPADGYQLGGVPPSRWLIAGLTALVIVSGYAWWRWLARRLAKVETAEARPRSTWSAAAELRALEVAEGDLEGFFVQLKAIVRRHCAERFGLPAEVRTSEELQAALPRLSEQLTPCLQDVDLALFSQVPLERDGPERSRTRALAFVQQTEEAS